MAESPAESPTEFDEQLLGLLGRCAAADPNALQRLYELVSPILFACLTRILRRRALAEEALQDVFVSIWQRAEQFEGGRGPARIWLLAIARHRAIDVLRSERVDPYREADVEQLPQPAPEGVGDWSSVGRSAAALARCFQELSGEQRRGIELAFV